MCERERKSQRMLTLSEWRFARVCTITTTFLLVCGAYGEGKGLSS